jgi:hypothetical protein
MGRIPSSGRVTELCRRPPRPDGILFCTEAIKSKEFASDGSDNFDGRSQQSAQRQQSCGKDIQPFHKSVEMKTPADRFARARAVRRARLQKKYSPDPEGSGLHSQILRKEAADATVPAQQPETRASRAVMRSRRGRSAFAILLERHRSREEQATGVSQPPRS